MTTLTRLALFPTPDKTRRKSGRPRVEDDASHRAKHMLCARMQVLAKMTVPQVADAFRVSDRTVQLWTRKALRYPGPESDSLRSQFAASGRPA